MRNKTVFEELRNVVLEEIKWSEKVNNKEVLERIGEQRSLRNNILSLHFFHNVRDNDSEPYTVIQPAILLFF